MKTIKVVDGKFKVPEKHCLCKEKRRLTIKLSWTSMVRTADKDCWQENIQTWFRNKERGDKPYIPEGYVELDGERYKLEVEQ